MEAEFLKLRGLGANGAFWAGVIQGASYALILAIVSFMSGFIVSGPILVLWMFPALLLIAHIVAIYINLHVLDDEEDACYLSGLMLGLGITGFFALPKFVSNILAIIAIYVGYNVNTTYGEGCQQQP